MRDITIQNFETDLSQASMAQPVLLDIWAPWCGPCKSLGPILERLEVAYAGRFKLAKLNSDNEPEIAGQLSQAFGVRSIPFCVLFDKGQPVDGFVGALPEAEVRAFLDRHVPTAAEAEAEEDAEAAQALEAAGDADAALSKLGQALALDPSNEPARLEYVKLLAEAGRAPEARQALNPLLGNPLLVAPRAAALAAWLDAIDAAPAARSPEQLAAAIAADRRDFAARFELARTHFAAQRYTAAMDELLEIIMRDKAWNDEAARKAYVAILELMTKPAPKGSRTAEPAKGALEVAGRATVVPSDPVVDQYRRKLSMAVF